MAQCGLRDGQVANAEVVVVQSVLMFMVVLVVSVCTLNLLSESGGWISVHVLYMLCMHDCHVTPVMLCMCMCSTCAG